MVFNSPFIWNFLLKSIHLKFYSIDVKLSILSKNENPKSSGWKKMHLLSICSQHQWYSAKYNEILSCMNMQSIYNNFDHSENLLWFLFIHLCIEYTKIHCRNRYYCYCNNNKLAVFKFGHWTYGDNVLYALSKMGLLWFHE